MYGSGGAVHQTTNLMGTLGVELGTGESSNKMADPVDDSAEGGNAAGITPFSTALRKEQVLVAKLVRLPIHNNTDIDCHMLMVPREHLFKGPAKSIFYAIKCLVLFEASLSHRVVSLPLTLFWVFIFTYHYLALNKGMI